MNKRMDDRIVRFSETRRGYGLHEREPAPEDYPSKPPYRYTDQWWFVVGLGAVAGCFATLAVQGVIWLIRLAL